MLTAISTNWKIMKIFDGFTHEDMNITNPTMSDGRFTSSPEYYGFAIVDTGGNCTAWQKSFDDGSFIMLTNEDGDSHELGPDCTPFMLGFYSGLEDDSGVIYEMLVGVPYDPEADAEAHADLDGRA
jgi:hypothetical protein